MNDEIEKLERRIAALEQKLTALDPSGQDEGTKLVAPVRIVDETGKLIAEISAKSNDRTIRVFNSKGQAVATLGADGTESGYLAVRSRNGKLLGYLDVERYGARLQLRGIDDDSGGLALFGGDSDAAGGGINIIAANNANGISLWAKSDSGEICIEDAKGNERVINSDTG